MKRLLFLGVGAMAALASAPAVLAFCGFYVAKADTKLFNQASQVVLVRNDDKTVLTMASDFKGDPKEFAVVVPVPTLLEKGQIHVGERATIEHHVRGWVRGRREGSCGGGWNRRGASRDSGSGSG